MSFDVEAPKLAGGQLSTVDCVAQSLAVGPVFSGGVLGGLLAFVLAPGAGPFVILLTTVGVLGIGWTLSEFAKRYSGSGTVYEFTIDMVGTSVEFQPGHRIRIDLASSHFPQFDRNPNTGDNPAKAATHIKATNVVYHNHRHASALVVPIVP